MKKKIDKQKIEENKDIQIYNQKIETLEEELESLLGKNQVLGLTKILSKKKLKKILQSLKETDLNSFKQEKSFSKKV